MSVNLKLGNRREVDSELDPMSRSWVGWGSDCSDQELFEQNRGVWYLGDAVREESIATFSHAGSVVAVVEIAGIEDIQDSLGVTKQAIIGRTLASGDAAYDAAIGQPVDSYRNPVTYPVDGWTPCACGCGEVVQGQLDFLSNHGERAINERIAEEWGTTLRFIQWFDATYGNPRDRTDSSEPG